MRNPPSLLWDLFCRVIDNYGDLGVCWRLARVLAARGHRVRLWVDDPAALTWMAPRALEGGVPGIEVMRWTEPLEPALLASLPVSDVWIEAFGCEIPAAFQARYGRRGANSAKPPVWINLEYLSAEAYVERMHCLPSPVMSGPAAGATKWFFYPGFTLGAGGLLREDALFARQRTFDRAAWLTWHGVAWHGERLVSLFCYEPPALADFLCQLARTAPTRLLVTAGRAAAAVDACWLTLDLPAERLAVSRLPYLTQDDYDALLWASDLNCVRGEDSLVRALWAGKPFIWQPYPQQGGAHRQKLSAFLDWLEAPDDLRRFHEVWSGLAALPLPCVAWHEWAQCVWAARERLRAQDDLATQLLRLVSCTH